LAKFVLVFNRESHKLKSINRLLLILCALTIKNSHLLFSGVREDLFLPVLNPTVSFVDMAAISQIIMVQ
jgi:hypothetical protein